MFERFTHPARTAVVTAQDHARRYHDDEITAVHLLLALMGDTGGGAARVLSDLGVQAGQLAAAVQLDRSADGEALETLGIDLEEVRRRAEEAFGPGALDRPRRQRRGLFGHRSAGGAGHLPFTAEAKHALEGALRASVARRDGFIGTEHLLLGLLDSRAGTALALLRQVGVTEDAGAIRIRIDEVLDRAA